MKEVELKLKESIEIVDQKLEKREVKLLRSQRRIPGLTLWQFETVTKLLTKAEYKKVDHKLNFGDIPSEKRYAVNIQENCIYFQALNEKNAIRVLKRDYQIQGNQ